MMRLIITYVRTKPSLIRFFHRWLLALISWELSLLFVVALAEINSILSLINIAQSVHWHLQSAYLCHNFLQGRPLWPFAVWELRTISCKEAKWKYKKRKRILKTKMKNMAIWIYFIATVYHKNRQTITRLYYRCFIRIFFDYPPWYW